jgi:Transglycosylase SLT domain
MLDRFTHPAGATAEAPTSPRADWLKPHRLDYLPLDDELAVVRLVAELRCGGPPADATLVVGGPEAVLRRDPLGSLTHSVSRRFRTADELLWRVTFALPFELVEYPEAIIGLTAAGCSPIRLPAPALATLSALSEPWPVGPRGAVLLGSAAWRRAAALGAVIAVAGTTSVSPALAASGATASGQACPVNPPPTMTAAALASSESPCAALWLAAERSHSSSQSSKSSHSSKGSASLVGHASSSGQDHGSAKPSAGHGKSGSASHSRSKAPAKSGAAPKSSVVASPAPADGSSGTDPGSAQAVTASQRAPVAQLAASGHDKKSAQGVASAGEHVSTLSPIPPGSLKGGLQPTLDGAVGHAAQPAQHGAHGHHQTGPSRRHGQGHDPVPVRGAHPLGAGGGGSASPKPHPSPSVNPSSDSDSDSGLATGSNPFTTGSSLYSRLASAYSHLDQPPPFLIPIYKKAAAKFHIPWTVLAAINSVETDYGRNLNTSSAGAIGWMQFMPSTWAQYGMAIAHSGPPNPYNPADAIYSAARYLAANGGAKDISQAIFAYNHAQWYVDEVMVRAQLIRDHSHGGLVNPFPLGWVPNRLDMGYDGTFTGAILAPFSGTITYAAHSFSNWGGWVELKADHVIPGLASDTLYFAEGLAPAVKTGEHVTAGQLIAVPAPSPYGDAYNTTSGGSGQIEWGLASPGLPGTPTDPLATTVSRPVDMVIGFALWVVKNLGLTPPSQTNNAGFA